MVKIDLEIDDLFVDVVTPVLQVDRSINQSNVDTGDQIAHVCVSSPQLLQQFRVTD
jgi:hypothetical protein